MRQVFFKAAKGISAFVAISPAAVSLCWPSPPDTTIDNFPVGGSTLASEPRITTPEDPRVIKQPGETPLDFIDRASLAVHYATYHCDSGDFSHNWLAFIGAKFDMYPKNEGLITLEDTVCGFCSQRAFLLAKVLRTNGVAAELYGLGGHVVTIVELANKRYFVDPDYGVAAFSVDLGDSQSEAKIFKYYREQLTHPLDENLKIVSKRYATTYDNEAYSSFNQMNSISLQQSSILRWRYPIEAGISLLGAVFFVILSRKISARVGTRT